MKSIKSILIILMCVLVVPSQINAQFLKKIKDKVENKADEVLGLDEDETNNSSTNITENNSSNNHSNATNENVVYPEFDRGEIMLFSDIPNAEETVNETPLNWQFMKANANENDNLEIVTFEGEKVIRLPKRDGISPIILENETDYLPENFTLEFDASFSANAPNQRYWFSFYDQITQNDIVEYETRVLELTFTTFGVTDGLTEQTLNNNNFYQESQNLVWRHIAISYSNNNIDIYYDEQHMLHRANIEGNLIGITISRSEFSDNNRYLKNIHLATNN
jgi:hypothetical protein